MKLKVNIDYRIKWAPGEEHIPYKEVTQNYITVAARSTYKELEGTKRRIHNRILRKIDDAIEKDEDYIELETAEKEFLEGSFKDAKVDPGMSKYFSLLEDEINNLGKEEKSAEEGK